MAYAEGSLEVQTPNEDKYFSQNKYERYYGPGRECAQQL